jgi:hypothetical protein
MSAEAKQRVGKTSETKPGTYNKKDRKVGEEIH